MQKQVDNNQGLVIAYFGNSVAVEAADGQVFQCQLRRNQALPVVGDIVIFEQSGNETVSISNILPRKSVLTRGDSRGKAETKPIAANVDQVVIVMATLPRFSDYLLDRYLIACQLVGIASVIVLNKMDLLTADELKNIDDELQTYQSIGFPVIESSAICPQGLDKLKMYLTNKQSVLVGPSGVGKSSIIAAISPEASLKIGEVSHKGIGKHTTTATRLYHIPEGGSLIDSPGVREFGLWKVTEEEIHRGFPEFKNSAGRCKFRDCKHLKEPGCFVKQQIEEGEISQKRWESYQLLMNDYIKK